MTETKTVTVSGPPFPLLGVLTIVFVVLKLTGVIHWSWWLVLLPLWGPFALLLVVAGIVALVAALSVSRSNRKRVARRYTNSIRR